MRLSYVVLCIDEIPIWSSVRSTCCHVWTPRLGWVRQRRPVQRRAAWKVRNTSISDLNAMVHMTQLKTHRVAGWVRDKVRKFASTDGNLIVVVKDYGDGFVSVGLVHDTRSQYTGFTSFAESDWMRKFLAKRPYLPRTLES